VLFSVYIIDDCASTVVTATSISSQTYHIGDAASTLFYSSFTESIGSCGSFTYIATYTNGTALDTSVISFTSSSRKFVIYSSNPSKVGTYSIKVTGTLSLHTSLSNSFTFSLVITCIPKTITHTAVN
jgi:hypothetical protein